MGEVTEKIYCCDRGDNDNALAAAILAGNNRKDDWGSMAAMMGGGMNNWMNDPFAYLMFLALFRNGGFGFGGDGVGTAIFNGMIFCRWTADAIGKAIKLDWEKFV